MLQIFMYSFSKERNVDFKVDDLTDNLKRKLFPFIRDEGYYLFLQSVGNGGFFFNYSLQIYSLLPADNFNNIFTVNNILNAEFGELFYGLCSFGQDVLANQFVFDIATGDVLLFNIETGDRESLAKDFAGWLKVLMTDPNFLSGEDFITEWLGAGMSLSVSQRLVPKIPFVIGGDYQASNFYASSFPKYLMYYGDLAGQIHSLKDGEKVHLRIKYDN